MLEINAYLIDALNAMPGIVDGLLNGYTPEEMKAGNEGSWSIVEVVSHLRDHEERLLERMRQMRDQVNPAIMSYDQEGLAIERGYAANDLQKELDAFKRLRGAHTAELEKLKRDEWEKAGAHLVLGRVTIASQTMRAVCHDAIHLAQIAKQVGRANPNLHEGKD